MYCKAIHSWFKILGRTLIVYKDIQPVMLTRKYTGAASASRKYKQKWRCGMGFPVDAMWQLSRLDLSDGRSYPLADILQETLGPC